MSTKSSKKQRGGKRQGAGRKPIYEEPRETISGSVPQSTAHRTRSHAQQTEQTISEVIAAAIDVYLSQRGA